MQHGPYIAIISRNSLMNLGLKQVIERMIPRVSVLLFDTADDVVAQRDEQFVHYFISEQVFAHWRDYFAARPRKTIILVDGSGTVPTDGMHTLDVSQSEEQMVCNILRLQHHGHAHNPAAAVAPKVESSVPLSVREREVLALVVRGFLNKEIAAELAISIHTVITHRRNIVERLGIRSVSALTIYAVTHNLVDIESI